MNLKEYKRYLANKYAAIDRKPITSALGRGAQERERTGPLKEIGEDCLVIRVLSKAGKKMLKLLTDNAEINPGMRKRRARWIRNGQLKRSLHLKQRLQRSLKKGR